MLTKFKDSEDYVIAVSSRDRQNQEFKEKIESIKLVPNNFLRKLTNKPNDIFTVNIHVLLEIFNLCDLKLHANIRDI